MVKVYKVNRKQKELNICQLGLELCCLIDNPSRYDAAPTHVTQLTRKFARPRPTSPFRCGWVWLGVAGHGCVWVWLGVAGQHLFPPKEHRDNLLIKRLSWLPACRRIGRCFLFLLLLPRRLVRLLRLPLRRVGGCADFFVPCFVINGIVHLFSLYQVIDSGFELSRV